VKASVALRRLMAVVVVLLWLGSERPSTQEAPQAPQQFADDTLRFAVIGDNGDGSKEEYEIAQRLVQARATFPFELVLMLGDNMYGRQQPKDFVDKFERPFAPLLQAGVPFYAAIGNHDSSATLFYSGFNMGGRRYYTYARKQVRFFVLDTNLLERTQLGWFADRLAEATEPWKIAYFHHPLYSDGNRHGSNEELRVLIEPLLLQYGVSVVFAGHDHVYGRTLPQKGIVHFLQGASGKLRKGGVRRSPMTAATFADDRSFTLVEIAGHEMRFQTISRMGRVVDSGVIRRRGTTDGGAP
jgi:3',5'-cyclic AMP phosphodiesterase CpdA